MNQANSKAREGEHKSVLVELLRQKSQEGHNILSQYIRAFAIYVTITGALIKFAFDKNATPELTQGLFIIGTLLSMVALFTCVLGEKLRHSIADEISNLNKRLGSPLISTQLLHLKYTVIVAFLFTVLVIASWIYLIVQ